MYKLYLFIIRAYFVIYSCLLGTFIPAYIFGLSSVIDSIIYWTVFFMLPGILLLGLVTYVFGNDSCFKLAETLIEYFPEYFDKVLAAIAEFLSSF